MPVNILLPKLFTFHDPLGTIISNSAFFSPYLSYFGLSWLIILAFCGFSQDSSGGLFSVIVRLLSSPLALGNGILSWYRHHLFDFSISIGFLRSWLLFLSLLNRLLWLFLVYLSLFSNFLWRSLLFHCLLDSFLFCRLSFIVSSYSCLLLTFNIFSFFCSFLIFLSGQISFISKINSPFLSKSELHFHWEGLFYEFIMQFFIESLWYSIKVIKSFK